MPLLNVERHQYILSYLNENHRIYITDMSNKLGVSDDTLRRDLAELEQHGLLTKVHGGAISKSGIPFDFTSRMQKDIDKKKNLASKIVSFFKDGDVILIDGGTSNLEVIRQISPELKITIYTNSFPIAEEVMNYTGFELVFLGGTLFYNSRVTVGIPVYQSLQTIHAD